MRRVLALPILAVCCLSALAVEPWRDAAFAKRVQIAIDHNAVSATLTWHPLLVKGTDTWLPGGVGIPFADVEEDKWAFYDAAGNKMNSDKEKYADNAGAGYANFEIWVSLDGWQIDSASDTYIWMYYSPTASDPGTATGVWDVNFKAVYHLSEASGTVYDSTSNNLDLAASGSPSYAQAGKIGSSMRFVAGTSDYLSTGTAALADFPVTLSCWFSGTDAGQNMIYVGDKDHAYGKVALSALGATAGDPGLSYADSSGKYTYSHSTDGFSAATWTHLVGTMDDGDTADAYLNAGTSQAEITTGTVGHEYPWDTTSIGALRDSTPSYSADVYIDEARISNIVRSSSWIAFEHSNVSEADNELTAGSPETYSPPAGGIPGHLNLRNPHLDGGHL